VRASNPLFECGIVRYSPVIARPYRYHVVQLKLYLLSSNERKARQRFSFGQFTPRSAGIALSHFDIILMVQFPPPREEKRRKSTDKV
jgi:hypothetical protein